MTKIDQEVRVSEFFNTLKSLLLFFNFQLPEFTVMRCSNICTPNIWHRKRYEAP